MHHGVLWKLTLSAVGAAWLAGCAGGRSAAEQQRGWIGGDYRAARRAGFASTLFTRADKFAWSAYPVAVAETQRVAILVARLATNTPANQAGLRQGDLILRANGHRMTRLIDFRRAIERSKPGAALPLTIYRSGAILNIDATVGRETFRPEGTLSLSLPTVVHGWDLWPNPDVSLVFLGFSVDRGLRAELDDHDHGKGYDQDWRAWLVLFELSKGKQVIMQESFVPR